jgi:DnaK suppressor protein
LDKKKMANTRLNKNYIPSEKEKYMNSKQLEYFKRKLLEQKELLIGETEKTMSHLKEEKLNEPDVTENVSTEADIAVEVRLQEIHNRSIKKIDASLERIQNKTYGYCVKSGSPIGVERLKAKPFATLCVEERELYEKEKKSNSNERNT